MQELVAVMPGVEEAMREHGGAVLFFHLTPILGDSQGKAVHPSCVWSPLSVPNAALTSPLTGSRRKMGRSCASSA